MITTNLHLHGLHCPACKKLTEKKLGAIPGVASVTVDLDTGEVSFRSGEGITLVQITAALSGTTYSVTT